jgi:hypothetical protein
MFWIGLVVGVVALVVVVLAVVVVLMLCDLADAQREIGRLDEELSGLRAAMLRRVGALEDAAAEADDPEPYGPPL